MDNAPKRQQIRARGTSLASLDKEERGARQGQICATPYDRRARHGLSGLECVVVEAYLKRPPTHSFIRRTPAETMKLSFKNFSRAIIVLRNFELVSYDPEVRFWSIKVFR